MLQTATVGTVAVPGGDPDLGVVPAAFWTQRFVPSRQAVQAWPLTVRCASTMDKMKRVLVHMAHK